jgi:hypothetical protein
MEGCTERVLALFSIHSASPASLYMPDSGGRTTSCRYEYKDVTICLLTFPLRLRLRSRPAFVFAWIFPAHLHRISRSFSTFPETVSFFALLKRTVEGSANVFIALGPCTGQYGPSMQNGIYHNLPVCSSVPVSLQKSVFAEYAPCIGVKAKAATVHEMVWSR